MALKTAVALGFFDGVHLAHQKIISSAVKTAGERGLRPSALTFDAPPSAVLWGDDPLLLTDNFEKQRLIASLGADCVLLGTTKSLLKMKGEDFVKTVLSEKMNIAHAVCGYNYTFGSDRLTCGDLVELGKIYGFSVCVLPEECVGGVTVSSSRIRALIAAGNMSAAATLLGRDYSVTGIVEHGKRLGRTMGFPTINVYPSQRRALMPFGVYATRVHFDGEEHLGVTNVGINPTVNDSNIRIETHIIDFDGDLYGKLVETKFLRFIRPEQKFASIDELFAQIGRDRAAVLGM